ncbi:MAG: hypothetical protein HOH43_16905 [Candidatus Latescibacteria bacterium]|jgi:hypothetical protein|nr:hypothetical protein [Candidatus Latescibacterota bacterium]
MIQKFGFDFADFYVAFSDLRFAFRIVTFENVFGIDPDRVAVTGVSRGIRVEADGLRYAGGQRKEEGSFSAELRREGDTLTFQATGRHQHDIKGLSILIRDLAKPVAEADEKITCWPSSDLSTTAYPEIETETGRVAVLPDSAAPRYRRWCVYREYSGNHVFNLSEDNGSQVRSATMSGSKWRLLLPGDSEGAKDLWYGMLERDIGLQAWSDRPDVPCWFRQISLVLNMHCEGWSGYVFNTFERQLQILKWIAERIDGRQVLLYLPGWDGRYYWNYPIYEPSEACGGAAALHRLVDGAHKLGMHVAPMFGAVASNYTNTRTLHLEPAVSRMQLGMPEICDWTDWDEDLSTEPIWQALNLGEVTFRQHMLNRISWVTDTFGTDGAMLDISGWMPRDPENDLLDGLSRLIESLHNRYEEYLIFGENGCDLHLPLFPLFQHGAHLPHDHPFHRYCRSAYHLYCGAPGQGSTGVYESGHNPFVPPEVDLAAIPTLAIVQDTLPEHQAELEAALVTSKEWAERWL